EQDVVRDVWIADEQIIAAEDVDQDKASSGQTIDVSGCILMAGGIDLHTHIGGGKLTIARMLMPESRPCEFLPSTWSTGNAYASMGYSAAFEPAMIACNARQAHAEMADTPHLDTGAYVLLGNETVLLRMLSEGVPQAIVNDYVAWMVTATQAIGVKVVNPGGIDAFKFNARAMDVDTPHPRWGVTPGQIIRSLAAAVYQIGLPHPLHIHCSNLGVAGNIRSTLATIRAADGYPIHLTHAQFHSYGSGGAQGFSTAAAELVSALDQHRSVTLDVGQVMFGQTVTVSGDTMHQYENSRFAKPRKSVLMDIDCQAGCGIVPFRYRNKQFVHSLQWAIGLELFLMVDDPSRVFLTTDHPNGGPFTSYPHLIRLLMDRSFRETALDEIHADAAAACSLRGLDREYSLSDIATMTRSAPAKLLGLQNLATLAPGSVADIIAYKDLPDREQMFKKPAIVIRRGQAVDLSADESAAHDWSRLRTKKVTHTGRPSFDARSIEKIAQWHADQASYRLERLVISDDELQSQIGSRPVVHPCRERQDRAVP
ncbi:MAG: formylmethanofuran dehydrogenase subunit A, partial [Planctomycetaceae bacterium]